MIGELKRWGPDVLDATDAHAAVPLASYSVLAAADGVDAAAGEMAFEGPDSVPNPCG